MDSVKTRLQNVLRRRVKPLDSCVFDPVGQLEQVNCKLCGCALQAMATYKRELLRRGSEMVAVESQRLMPTTQYDALRIILKHSGDQQAAHDTPLCSRCKRDVMALAGPKLQEVLEELYCCDLYTWMQEEKLQKQSIPWEKVGSAVPIDIDRNV